MLYMKMLPKEGVISSTSNWSDDMGTEKTLILFDLERLVGDYKMS